MAPIKHLSRRDTAVSLLIIAVLFFVFGFVTWINAILIPYFKIACELDNFESYLVAFAFYISYLVMAWPASWLLKRGGFKKGMMIGFFTMAAGAAAFVPAAGYRRYGLFLTGLFLIGTGLTILQTAANPYITILGPKDRAAQRISIVGICNKAAGILAPLLLAAVLVRPADTALIHALPAMNTADKAHALDLLIRRVITPYALASVVLLAMGIGVRYSPLPEIEPEETPDRDREANRDKTNILQFPQLVLGAVALFLHVGTQVIAVDTVIGYAGSMGIGLREAKAFPSYTLISTIAGYVLGIITIPKFISQTNALRLCTSLGLTLSILVLAVNGTVHWLGHSCDLSLWFVVLLGLANSLIWAGIWPLALDGLGRFTKPGASLLIMGLSGNALLPLVYGRIADAYDLRTGYCVLIPCYGYLLFYALSGHRIRHWKRRPATAGLSSTKTVQAHE